MSQNQWSDIPMGPALQTYLQCFNDSNPPLPTAQRRQDFAQFLFQYINDNPVKDNVALTGIVDELLTLDLATLGLHAIQNNPQTWNRDGFQTAFLEGIALMSTGNLDEAITCFEIAQDMEPLEPAPYSNIASILLELEQYDGAKEWAEAGVKACSDHIKLWTLLGQAYASLDQKDAFVDYATQTQNWIGLCIASEFTKDPIVNRRMWLEKLYKSGERDPSFLTEYSGCLGSCGYFEDIPSLIWEAKNHNSQLPWQLELNGLQALLSLEKDEEFMNQSQTFLTRKDLPQDIPPMIQLWQTEFQKEA